MPGDKVQRDDKAAAGGHPGAPSELIDAEGRRSLIPLTGTRSSQKGKATG